MEVVEPQTASGGGGTGKYGVAVGCLGMPYTLLREIQGELGSEKWLRVAGLSITAWSPTWVRHTV
jgi:hypothetical protein